jgi:methylated-DNA-[protein]-cysteine S-methyltransferase
MIPDGLEIFKSPIGEIEIAALNDMLISCNFSRIYPEFAIQPNRITREGVNQLEAYFTGKLKKFDLPLDYEGTQLQIKIMKLLETVPYGQTISYSDLAKILALHLGSRAVGNLIGRNPLLILVPCHRVIGSNGKITGYAGGTERKLWLLQHEINNTQSADRLF